MGQLDTTGTYRYDEDDDEVEFSDLLNLAQAAESNARAFFHGTGAQRAALDPAPAGAYWQDTDGTRRLWSTAPDGTWRRHEGAVSAAAGALAAAGGIYGRTVTFDLPTVIAANETIQASQIDPGGGTYTWASIATITRLADKTQLTVRHMAAVSGSYALAIAWRVVKGV
ncbi:MAG: hypothetical protein D3X82_01260 [Candidatus Leucobacter sulfamidivorax]|nr:hypothetical protein [Candidatus Leucobacter sulfamidivorax]